MRCSDFPPLQEMQRRPPVTLAAQPRVLAAEYPRKTQKLFKKFDLIIEKENYEKLNYANEMLSGKDF